MLELGQVLGKHLGSLPQTGSKPAALLRHKTGYRGRRSGGASREVPESPADTEQGSKNHGKVKIQQLVGFSNGNGSNPEINFRPETKTENHHNSYDKQATITRLAVLNTATEILKTHDQPIQLEEVFFLGSRLEAWALGN